MSKQDILPEGESLRRAVRWMSDHYRDNPSAGFGKLIDEAAIRFDLSPLEVEFLRKNWAKPGITPED